MSSSRLFLFATCGLAGVVACARIAGLDDSGGSAQSATDGGVTTTSDGLKLVPAQLSITTACNAPGSSELRIQNTGAAKLDYTLESGDAETIGFKAADGKTVGTLSGSLAAGKASDPISVVATSGTAGAAAKSFTVSTGKTQTIVPVALQVEGSLIELAPTVVEFGEAHHNATTGALDVIITNKGTETVVIDRWDTGGDSAVLMSGGAISVPPNATGRATVAYQAGNAGTPLDAMVKPVTSSVLCGAIPSLHVTGTSVSTAVTVTPAKLPFDQVGCGNEAGPKQLSIANFSNGAATYTLTFQTNTWFKSSAPTGSVPAGGAPVSVPISLIAQQTFGERTENVTVEVTGPTVDPKITTQVPLTVSVRGAQLAFSPASLTVPNGSTQTVRVTNAGNEGTGLLIRSGNGFQIDPPVTQIGKAGSIVFGDSFTFNVKATAARSVTDVSFAAAPSFAGNGPICGTPTVHVVSP